MSNINQEYLKELQAEHKIVAKLLEETKGLIQTKHIADMAARIDSLKKGLSSHLKKEDDKIYPELLKVAREKKIELIEITIRTFTTAMKGIGERVGRFFEKYQNRDDITRLISDFSHDFQGVYEDLFKRVNNEERVLYPMYEKYCC